MKRTIIVGPLVVAAAAIGGACTNVTTDRTRAVAIEFDSLPFPAVVSGDTLRDSLGRVMPLRALAFNSSGARMPGASIQYFALDTGLTIDAAGIVTAQREYGPIRIVASVNGLQSIQKTLEVARRPDTLRLANAADSVTTLAITSPDNPGANVTGPLKVTLASGKPFKTVVTATRGWLVTWRLLFKGAPLSPTDTTIASLWGASGTNVSLTDTTTADGVSSRRLRIRVLLPDDAPLVVQATARYRGALVRGSPVTFTVRTSRKP